MASIYQTAKGSGVNFRDEYGRGKSIFIGSDAAARAAAVQIEIEVAEARRKLRVFEATQSCTFRDAFQVFNRRRDAARSTKLNDEIRIHPLMKLHGDKLAWEVTHEHLQEFIDWQRTLKAPSTVYQIACLLKKFYAAALNYGLVPCDCAGGLMQKPPKGSCARALSSQEVEDVLACVGNVTRGRVLLAVDAGLRSGEMILIRKSSCNFKQRTLQFFRPKTTIMSEIPLTARLSAELERRAKNLDDPDALLYSRQGKKLRRNSQFVRSVRYRSGVSFRLHDLRHTFASRVARTGCRNRILQVLLGHAARTPSELYDHPTLDELRKVIEQMEKETTW